MNPRRPLSVGFWFSLGHSTVVFGLAALLALGVRALVGPVEDENSTMQTVLGFIGTSVSGVFLWILGIINLVVLIGIVKVFRDMRSGRYDESELEDRLNKRGLMNRLLRGVSVAVALAIGTVELLGVLAERAHVDSGPLSWIASINLDYAGFVIVGLFVAVWAVALLIWRYGRIEDRWTAR